MKKLIVFALIILTCNFVVAQYKPIEKGSSVKFTIKNFGINTGGSFTGLQGDINFDKDHPEEAKFVVSIDANTINTDNDMRDNHLREASYFDVKKYPRISFVSTKISRSTSGELVVYGKLTIKDQTRDISFPFTFTASNNGYLFNGTFNINRKDFGVGGSSTISNNLDVQLIILATK